MVRRMTTLESGPKQDWRLLAKLDVADRAGALRSLLGRLRGPDIVAEIRAQVPRDVVITHDGELLFAYAATKAELDATRSAIEGVLRNDAIPASIRMSHWEDALDEWLQTDPPPSADERQIESAAERDAEAVQTRTLVASSGRLVRSEFEQSMSNWAEQLGLQCKIVEHPHLLQTQIAFTVTGPRRKIDEFSKGMIAEGWVFVRTETGVMASPI
jgi:hypothetical protein